MASFPFLFALCCCALVMLVLVSTVEGKAGAVEMAGARVAVEHVKNQGDLLQLMFRGSVHVKFLIAECAFRRELEFIVSHDNRRALSSYQHEKGLVPPGKGTYLKELARSPPRNLVCDAAKDRSSPGNQGRIWPSDQLPMSPPAKTSLVVLLTEVACITEDDAHSAYQLARPRLSGGSIELIATGRTGSWDMGGGGGGWKLCEIGAL
ncbi:hypothetical protein BU15DRAFT_65778 [Melanogaster broomeanus]|nr:hypothetical protein BU15DRAFT_65778 [Melanogaster broomeanus]